MKTHKKLDIKISEEDRKALNRELATETAENAIIALLAIGAALALLMLFTWILG